MKLFKKYSLYFAWIVSLVSVFGSLYFSEVLNFTPCVLCWAQRIFMYPIALLIPVGILRDDKKVYLYILPLSILGFLFSLYQNLLYYGILPETVSPCVEGVSCVTKFINWFGFVSIPLLSLISFTTINIFMVIFKKLDKTKQTAQ